MRLDKYMKLTRLCKRRETAQEMIGIGAVRVDGRLCKPSCEVKAGSIVEIAYAAKVLKIEVVCADEATLKRGSAGHYSVLEETAAAPDIRPW